MKKGWMASLIIVLLLTCFTSQVFAWYMPANGKPDMYRPGDVRGYFIWQDSEGMHLRVTTRGQEHRFTGTIRTNGKFLAINGRSLEWNDRIRTDYEHSLIRFGLSVAGGTDGIDFKVHGGNHLKFDLYIDDERINPHEIYIGDEGWQPGRSHFTIYR